MDSHKPAGLCAIRLWIASTLACGLIRQMVREKHLGTVFTGIFETKGCTRDFAAIAAQRIVPFITDLKCWIQQGAKLLSVSVSPSLPMSFSPQSGWWGSEVSWHKLEPWFCFPSHLRGCRQSIVSVCIPHPFPSSIYWRF